ncbi:hypothetical protein SmJEL517_g05534 [Synchytrium microbalum]|uniref:Alpha-1,3-mannosyltransferase n=1 Tax=Synchytrium microbalum TaxID=1806994 RepID=A0A507BTU9_9FUNG|nr:uncharacterized protein SmJEL517_g05534 [Synchytrium microbalum]TPX31012.1 hypothetical protein SmJEL517_g05534 [Synchytrium microbalum]
MYLPAPATSKIWNKGSARPLLTPYTVARGIIVVVLLITLLIFGLSTFLNAGDSPPAHDIEKPAQIGYSDSDIDSLHKSLAEILKQKDSAAKLKQIVPLFKQLRSMAVYTSGTEFNISDFREMGRRVLTHKLLFELYHDEHTLKPKLEKLAEWAEVPALLKSMEVDLFPWMFATKRFTSAKQLRDSYSGRGIVMTTGLWHFRFAHHAVLALRTLIKTDLPIELYYAGRHDLHEEQIKILSNIPNVKVIDVTKILGDDGGLGGWAVKPYSMLASSFKEMIFLDADALFLKDPRALYDYERYEDRGAVFFHDRTVKGWDKNLKTWFATLVSEPSDTYKQSRIFQELSIHEQDSGVVLLDKVRAFHGLLTVCKMNGHKEHTEVYKHMHGDKETFWISFEMVRVPYAFNPFHGGAVGYLAPDGAVCGGLFHPDEQGQPLWFNGGVLVNKYHSLHNTLNFTHAGVDAAGRGVSWRWETPTTPFCLEIDANVKTDERREVIELSPAQKALTLQYVELWKQCCDYE